jgi:hypothetical protein
MKKFNLILSSFAIVAILFLFSCGGTESSETNADSAKVNKSETTDSSKVTKNDANKTEKVAKYICPMHCKGSDSDKAGTCPVCGMDLIENPDFKN